MLGDQQNRKVPVERLGLPIWLPQTQEFIPRKLLWGHSRTKEINSEVLSSFRRTGPVFSSNMSTLSSLFISKHFSTRTESTFSPARLFFLKITDFSLKSWKDEIFLHFRGFVDSLLFQKDLSLLFYPSRDRTRGGEAGCRGLWLPQVGRLLSYLDFVFAVDPLNNVIREAAFQLCLAVHPHIKERAVEVHEVLVINLQHRRTQEAAAPVFHQPAQVPSPKWQLRQNQGQKSPRAPSSTSKSVSTTHLLQPLLKQPMDQALPLLIPPHAEDPHRDQLLPFLRRKSQTLQLTLRNTQVCQGLGLLLVSGAHHSPQCSSGRISPPCVPG